MTAATRTGRIALALGWALHLGAGLIAVLGTVAWALGRAPWGAWGPEHVPMAPSSGILLLSAVGASFARFTWPSARLARAGCVLVGAVAAGFALTVLASPVLDWARSLERGLGAGTGSVGGVPLWRMSPATALGFLFVSGALLLPRTGRGGPPAHHVPATSLCLATALLGWIVLVAYVAQAPLLYGTGLVPMASTTASCFLLLGLGMLFSAGPEAWPVRAFTPAQGLGTHRLSALLLLGGLLVATTAGTYAASRYQLQLRARALDTAQHDLDTVAELKAQRIADWRAGLLHHADGLERAAFVAEDVRRFLADPRDDEVRGHVAGILDWVHGAGGATRIALLDPGLALRLGVPEPAFPLDDTWLDLARGAIRDGHVQISDAELEPRVPIRRVRIAVPLLGTGPPRAAPGGAVAVVLLEVDPRASLDSFLEAWPTASRSGRLLLLRSGPAAGLTPLGPREAAFPHEPRAPSDEDAAGSVEMRAARGEMGSIVGTDLRGASVLATLRPVPGSTWSLVAMVDEDEAMGLASKQARLVVLILGLTTALLWAAAGVVWKRGETEALRVLLDAQRERLRASEQIAHLMRSANDAILLTDEAGCVLDANDRALSLYGKSLHDLQRANVGALLDGPGGVASSGLPPGADTPEGCVTEAVHRRADGSRFDAEVSARLVEWGGARRGLVIVHDLTGRKAHLAAIERLTRFYDALSQVNQAIVHAPDRDALLQKVCELLVSRVGMHRAWVGEVVEQELVVRAASGGFVDGASVLPPGPASGMPGHALALRAASEGNELIPARSEEGLACAAFPLHEGERRWGALLVEAEDAALFGAQEVQLLREVAGDVGFAIENAHEGERRRRAQEAVTESERRYRTLFERAAEGILVAELESRRVRHANPAACRLFGYTETELLARRIDDLHPGSAQRDVLAEFRRSVAGEGHFGPALPCLRKDGTLFQANVMGAALSLDGVPCIVGFFTNVSQLLELEAQVRQASKMEALGNLAGGVAHDFNNLLTVINGYAEMLVGSTPESDPRARHLRQILGAGERAAGLTRQLLVFSRREIVQPKLLDPVAVTREVLGMLRRTISERIEITLEAGERVGLVVLDPTQLEQVILNLAVNARDAMPNGGRLCLEIRNATPGEVEPARGRLPSPADGWILICVTDTGVGMDAATRARLFEPFFTTKEHGTGLGLATVFGVVGQAGGQIRVESEVGRGSTFRIYLPRAPACEPRAGVAPVAAARQGSESILLVEDDAEVRSICQEALVAHGYEVVGARGGEAAVATLGTRPFSLLVTDVVMPGIDGPGLAERLRTHHRDLRVLFISGYTENTAAARRMVDLGAGFLQKPFSGAALAAKVREVLDAPAPRF